MPRPALSASRAAIVLNFLAAYPDREFSMAEIARSTKINTASCHAILSALASVGFLARSEDEKRYTLGVALIAVGRAASAANPLIARAQAAALKLANDLRVTVLLNTVLNDEILGLALHKDGHGRGLGIAPGQRFPMAAPAGAYFMAWAPEAEIEAWIARAGTSSTSERKAWLGMLSLVRQRGYQVTLDVPLAGEFSEVMAELSQGTRTLDFAEHAQKMMNAHAWQNKQPEMIEPGEVYAVSSIAAPIFNRDGRSVLGLSVGSFGRALTGLEIKNFATELLQTCVGIMTDDRGTSKS